MFFHQGLLYFVLRSCTLIGLVRTPTFEQISDLTGPVMIIGVFFAINIITNNASLMFIGLSLNQCLKAGSPLIMIAVAYLIEGKRTSRRQIGASTIVVFGSLLVVLKNPGFNWMGVILCLISAVSSSFQLSAAAITMKGKSNLVFHVTMYTALVVTFLCIPFVIVLELDDFHDYAQNTSMLNCMGLLLLGGGMAIIYLLVTNALIVNGGSVYLTVLGNFKLTLIVLISCIVFKDELAIINIIGIIITIMGFAIYSYMKDLDKKDSNNKKDSKYKEDDIERSDRSESLYSREDDGSNEEKQSLLVNGNGNVKSTTKIVAAKYLSSCNAQFIEGGMALFILCMIIAVVCTPHHALKQGATSAIHKEYVSHVHAAAAVLNADHSPHHVVPVTTTTTTTTSTTVAPQLGK